jgi:circadian clock protein KaiC
VETHTLYEAALEVPIRDLSAVVENILFLRYVEDADRLARVISILKLRESGYDATLRRFTITNHGIEIAGATAPLPATDSVAPPPSAAARRRRGR